MTVDQYYDREVQKIYDTVITEVEKDKSRKFSFAETGFLMRWVEHNQTTVSRLQKLVQNGQIELIGGGWVQNDEAAAHYVDIIDQMTLGLEHLKVLFGPNCSQPKAAWQIDPFGHSREFANLAAQMGYESLYFGRIHYVDRSLRHSTKNNEFNWIGSDEQKTSLLTGALYWDYSPPSGFCFDSGCNDEEIQDDPNQPGYNVVRRAQQFLSYVTEQASHYKTKNVILTMGMDFNYQMAEKWYRNLDKLIKYFNANPSMGLNLLYSTPACYTKAVQKAQPVLTTKSDDFFPYASAQNSYWTGYFTSRPAFKGMIRQASSLLNLGKQLSAHFLLGDDAALETAKRASGLVQHHDAVTGTAKQVVTYDYQQRLHKGMIQLETLATHAIQSATQQTTAPKHQLCLEANETTCAAIFNKASYVATVFNPLGQASNTVVEIPSYATQAAVYDYAGQPITGAQLVLAASSQANAADGAPYTLYVPLQVDPLGFRSIYVDTMAKKGALTVQKPETPLRDATSTLENSLIRLEFNVDGSLEAVVDKTTGNRQLLKQQFYFYESAGLGSQPSGAYIFRPSKQMPEIISESIQLELIRGPTVFEARQKVTDWVSQTIRLHENQTFIEFDWVVGPIPYEKLIPTGKEVISRYSTNIASAGIFYTDSNGRQVLKRTRNSYPTFPFNNTEPVAGNYYPVTNRLFLKDASTQLTVLPDRAQAASSLADGSLELMLHRRCFFDDHFGVDEALNEPGKDGRGLVVRGKHTVLLQDVKTAASTHRPLAVGVFHKPVPMFADVQDYPTYRKNYLTRFAGLIKELPASINVLSLEQRSQNTVLLRLEHIFQANEDATLSSPVTIDLKKLFARLTVTAVQELSLGANRNGPGTDSTITLKPQQIGTYLLTVQGR
ncbi:unnamed protein product, partial [Mesorhabditis spiculigera]